MVAVVRSNGVVLNEEMIRLGHAWVWPAYCRSPFCTEWAAAEDRARRSRLGLWGEDTPLPPWSWRAQQQQHSE